MVDSNERALHLVSPKPVPWNAVFLPIADRLGVPAVPYEEWLERLKKAAATASAYEIRNTGVLGREGRLGDGKIVVQRAEWREGKGEVRTGIPCI